MISKLFTDKIKNKLQLKIVNFIAKSIVCKSGDRSEFCYIIDKGFVKVTETTVNGQRRTILILKEGDCFPLIWTFDHPDDVVYNYECLDDVQCSKILISELKKEISENPLLCKKGLEMFVHITWDLIERVKCLQMAYTQEKILRLLPYLSAKIGKNVKEQIYLIPSFMTQEEIAQLLGTTRESISTHLKQIKDLQIVLTINDNLHFDLSKLPTEYIYSKWFREHKDD